ncbi:transferrin-binding protein-like solute binding protein [Sphingomonas sp. QA11]|uniref:transferrin-binding protein-like solute binding protein n=1 Tax=Sphingomonas sp. QA11 TaxID=2950605 RepID=UPI002349E925|nr:transferrin-binding protein-like solute binding protein [Sphingomonas sp. QA11]WCM25888.1 transferrin-binding protein-like solute binding protein [Sphingomonas sp. QA11]
MASPRQLPRNPAPAGTVFALTQSAITYAASGQTLNSLGYAQGGSVSFAADTATNAGGATVTVGALQSVYDASGAGPIEKYILTINIPSLGINQTYDASNTITVGNAQSTTTTGYVQITSGASAGKYLDFNITSLAWLATGSWNTTNVAPPANGNDALNEAGSASTFLLGYQTPVSAMPTTGQAIYYAGANDPNGNPVTRVSIGSFFNGNGGPNAAIAGVVTITASFAAGGGNITGTVNNTTATYLTGYNASGSAVYATQPWNNLSLTGNIAGNLISGTANVTSNPANSTSLASGASGAIKGGFYGPNADQIGLIVNLNDSKSAFVGAIGTATKSNVIILP